MKDVFLEVSFEKNGKSQIRGTRGNVTLRDPTEVSRTWLGCAVCLVRSDGCHPLRPGTGARGLLGLPRHGRVCPPRFARHKPLVKQSDGVHRHRAAVESALARVEEMFCLKSVVYG